MKKKFRKLTDAVLIGSYEEVDGLELSTITKNNADNAKLNGLIIKGYETKFNNGTNTNRERYTKECLDNFVNDYFVANKLNMPVTLCHSSNFDYLVGRVLTLEVNSVGFYFVAYIPKAHAKYNDILVALKEGLLQGFSKEGWATDWESHYDDKSGAWLYDTITEMRITAVSLVATPANAQAFEKMQSVENGLEFIHEKPKKKRMFH